jgi:pyruvate dehydrogenase E2 component (dihydrolipoamide acetyltransferase)
VTLQDVEHAATVGAAPAAPIALPSAAAAPSDMRTLIAQSMSRAKREIPHYYLATTIDMRRALRWLEQHNAARPVTERLLYGVLLVKAVARALEGFPELNGFWRSDRFEPAAAINVGTAVRLRQGGLIAPALLAANERPLPELMRAFQDLVQRTRGKGLRSSELASATITVSSLGEGSVETVYPIIHPPQVAIVGFGAIVTRPWCDGDAVVAAPVITATLSADHRVSDGHRGSAFLVALGDRLQHPEAL